MAHRYPNQGYPPPRAMVNRGMQNRYMPNQGSLQDHSMPYRAGSTGQGLSVNERYQSNTARSNSGMPRPILHSEHGFQSSQYPNRPPSNTAAHTNQGFQGNQIMPNNRPFSKPLRNEGFHSNQTMNDRNMPDFEFNINQGFQRNRNMPNTLRDNSNSGLNLGEGYQTNKTLSNRDMTNPGMNTNQGFDQNLDMSSRDMTYSGMNRGQYFHDNQNKPDRNMSKSGMNTNHGFQTNQNMPNKGMLNPGMNTNQGFHPNQGLSNRDFPNPSINRHQDFLTGQSLPNRGMSELGINLGKGFEKNSDMPNRGMSFPRIDSGQGFETNQNIHGRGRPSPFINNSPMYDQQVYNHNTPQDNIHACDEKPPDSAYQDRFPVNQDALLERNSVRQMSSVGMQQCTVPQNTMPQAPIIQHVMIPVPVPVGSDIPPHLLRPQIITSSGQGLSSQIPFTGTHVSEVQHHSQLANIQGQFPIMHNQVQGHIQNSNLTGQSNMQIKPAQGEINASNSNISASNPGVNDLSYYLGNRTRNVNRHVSADNFHSSVNEGVMNDFQQDQMYRNREEHVEDFSHLYRDKFQIKQEEHEKERIKNDRSWRQNSSIHSSYPSHYIERSGQEVSRANEYDQSKSEMYDNPEHAWLSDKYRDAQHVNDSRDIRGTQRMESERRSEAVFITDGRLERTRTADCSNDKKLDFQRMESERRSEAVLITDGRLERTRTADCISDKKSDFPRMEPERRSEAVLLTDGCLERTGTADCERCSEAVLITDGRLERTRTADCSNEKKSDFQRHSDMKICFNNKHEILRESEKEVSKSVNSNVIYFKDEHADDLESSGSNDRNKRKHNPVIVDVPRKKVKQLYSPVSDSKSHGALKIHVSDSGRWIEGDHNFSPVSDGAYDDDKLDVEKSKGDMDNLQEKESEYDHASLDGAEMVSDNEGYTEDMSDAKLEIHAQNLSPVSQHSSLCESYIGKKKTVKRKIHDVEKVSPCRSNYSRYSEERSSSYQSKHSDYDNNKRSSSEKYEASEHLSDHRSHQESERQKESYKLNVPDLCRAHNQKGCYWDGCASLHVCKFYVIDQCKFGEHCTKGHDFFKSQPHGLLMKCNPYIKACNATAEEIKLILKEKIITQSKKFTSNSHNNPKDMSPIREPMNEVVAADPSFDARNYVIGNVVDARDELNQKKGSLNISKKRRDQSHTNVATSSKEHEKTGTVKGKLGKKTKVNVENSNESKYKLTDKNVKGKKNKKIKERNGKQTKTAQNKSENRLSPVSGDEEDWEKYEKYEQVSDDGMSEKEDEFENVSSDESSIEQVQVNRSVSSFPLPTAENIAVPIGMNDPLVFNRPLKNNPQSYIGPMNRPPPMFPFTGENITPLFPVVSQNKLGLTGIKIPGHLPSPEFMTQVIKTLPSFKVETTGEKGNIKKDNNHHCTELDTPKRKLKSDKVEREPELKETIKKLWKFPHKGIINMSIIEFVTETEAYKEEFIAEIVKILVTLELPYVTMKKLLSVIKEKVSINVKSENDLRKILEMYPNNFKIIEMVDSDDESDESEMKKNIQIKANIGVGFCEKHGFLPFAIGRCECNALHLCKFYFLSDCPVKLCKFGHRLKTDHNVAVLRQHKLHRLTGEELLNFLADIDNRNKETIPNICKYYIREKGCYKGDNTDFETICHSLHLCAYILKGKCMNGECDRSHSIHDKQPLSLLKKYALDPEELGDDKVLLILGEKCIENEKGKRNSSVKQNQKSISKPLSVSKDNKAYRGDARKSAGEGLAIVSHSETRLSSKYFVQNFKVPAVCKFYQNALGCRKKDWGAEGKCFFLHICQHYVVGDCNYGDKCKRSHDLFSGQAAEILEKYNFDLDSLTAAEILRRLNCNSGAPVELPTSQKSLNKDNENIEITIDSVGEPDEVDVSNFEFSKHSLEVDTPVSVRDKIVSSSRNEERRKDSNRPTEKSSTGAGISKPSSFASGNVEDVIKHIMEHNKVVKK